MYELKSKKCNVPAAFFHSAATYYLYCWEDVALVLMSRGQMPGLPMTTLDGAFFLFFLFSLPSLLAQSLKIEALLASARHKARETMDPFRVQVSSKLGKISFY